MTKKLVIHIGVHKTASTLIQQKLHAHRHELAAQDVWYDKDESYRLGTILMTQSPLDSEQIARYCDQFKALYADKEQDTIFWSCEGFVGDFWQSYDNLQAVAQDMKAITDGFDIELIAFVRRQDSFVESIYQQMVKQGDCADWDAFADKVNIQAFDWNAMLNQYQNVFPQSPIHVYPYEMLLDKQTAGIDAVLKHLEVSLDITVDRLVNPALSPLGLMLAKPLGYLPPNHLSTAYRKVLQRYFPKPAHQGYGVLLDDQRRELLTHYQHSNAALFDGWIKNNDWRDDYEG